MGPSLVLPKVVSFLRGQFEIRQALELSITKRYRNAAGALTHLHPPQLRSRQNSHLRRLRHMTAPATGRKSLRISFQALWRTGRVLTTRQSNPVAKARPTCRL